MLLFFVVVFVVCGGGHCLAGGVGRRRKRHELRRRCRPSLSNTTTLRHCAHHATARPPPQHPAPSPPPLSSSSLLIAHVVVGVGLHDVDGAAGPHRIHRRAAPADGRQEVAVARVDGVELEAEDRVRAALLLQAARGVGRTRVRQRGCVGAWRGEMFVVAVLVRPWSEERQAAGAAAAAALCALRRLWPARPTTTPSLTHLLVHTNFGGGIAPYLRSSSPPAGGAEGAQKGSEDRSAS